LSQNAGAESATYDPRAARSREAILCAARLLLEREGPESVTHQRVAREAGVGRATVYRHWPDPGQLLHDLINEAELPFFKDPMSPVRPWLRRELQWVARELASPAMAGVAVTLMHRARWDHATAERREHLMTLLTDRISAALDLAAAGGELADEPAEPAVVAAMLLGPMLFRRLMQDQPVSPGLIEQALDSAVTWRERPAAG
jgi:AcrR family transcriptional regulator